MKVDPIIAVKDVEASSKWYQAVLGLRSRHGGREFDILVNQHDEVLLCLHKWGEHDHPTMQVPDRTAGNGLMLYFRTQNMEQIRAHLRDRNYEVEEEIHLNPNSRRKEFSLRDPDGYYITITQCHKYEG